jgi:hypothetical protein
MAATTAGRRRLGPDFPKEKPDKLLSLRARKE